MTYLLTLGVSVLVSAEAGCAEGATSGPDAVAAVVRTAANRASASGRPVWAEWCAPGQYAAARPMCTGLAGRCAAPPLWAIAAAARGLLGLGLPAWLGVGVRNFDDVSSLAREGADGLTVRQRWRRRGLVEVGRVGRLVFFENGGEG